MGPLRLFVAGVVGAIAATQGRGAVAEEALPRLRLEPSITVSGLSSGAFFAHQFHLAFSDVANGVAIIAGGPYGCAGQVPWALAANPAPEVATAISVCTHAGRDAFGFYGAFLPQAPDPEDSGDAIEEARQAGEIDDPANIRDDRVWLLHGERDPIVPAGSMEAVAEVYRSLGVTGDRLVFERRRDAAHGFPVEADFAASACGATEPPYLIDCDLDAAGALLQQLLGPLAPPVAPVREHLRAFDQTPFFDTDHDRVSLAGKGFVYVPGACATGESVCRLHVAFHGCRQNADEVGDDFVWDAGYGGWAEANRIVVLYPQTTEWTSALDPSGLATNPNGCWDWWGYSGRGYATREAPQMRAARTMIEVLGVR